MRVLPLALCSGLLVFSASLTASGPQQTPAAGAQPTVVVGGIQVVKVVAAKDDTFGTPFNSENGTRLALWVKMPAGQGLIEIDEDASVLAHFGDDKGTDLGGKFGSFPHEFKDGSGGTLDILSTGMPAAGATRLMAEGTVVLNVSSGAKPQRVPNVAIDNGKTFMLGTTRITVAEVEMKEDEQTFTLKLPRTVMEGIKDVRFFDAKGQPVEGHKSGTGYMNDAGEMSLSVKSKLKTLSIEFDIWQGRRTIKVPFKVQAGVGLGG
jgi:hypothetical protein